MAKDVCGTRGTREAIAVTANADEANKAIAGVIAGKVKATMFESLINSMLSGPQTHMINIASNALTVLWSPTQDFVQGLSAAARLDFRQAGTSINESAAKLSGMFTGLGDTARLLYRQMGHTNSKYYNRLHGTEAEFIARNQRPSLRDYGIPEYMLNTHELAAAKMKPAMTAEEFRATGALGSAIDFMGNMIRLPGAMLLKEDKFFKLLHYRMEANAAAVRRVRANTNASAAEKRILYNVARYAPSENDVKNAVSMSEYYTFTNSLGETGGAAQRVISNTPAKLFIPFFKTPTNIVKMGIRNSAFGSVFKDLGDITARTAKGDAARARLALGTLMPATLLYHFGERFTGRIDQSTPEGRFQVDSGKKPYSILMGDTWVSYEGLEPARSIIGLYVNYKEAFENIEKVDPKTGLENPLVNELLVAAIAPMVKTVGDNYLLEAVGGMIDLAEGVNSGNLDYATGKLERLAASVVPYSNFMRQNNRELVDPVFRRANGIIDTIKSTIPGYSTQLPASMTIWGDERVTSDRFGPDLLSPVVTSRKKMDRYDTEITRLEANVPGEANYITIGGFKLDLTPEQRNLFSRIRGKGVDGDTPLKESVKQMMDSRGYQRLSDMDKKTVINAIFERATEMTRNYLFSVDESLRQQYEQKRDAYIREYQRTQRSG